jgi:hypothetical protein
MSKIVRLLERLGENAQFRYANAEQLAVLISGTDPALIDAVISGDQLALEATLGARSNIVCAIYPADEPHQDEPSDDEQDEDKIHLKHCG